MNTELFIAKRLSFDKKNKKTVQLMARIAMVSIALSMAVMIVATAVLSGFSLQLKERISGFNAHLRIVNLDSNLSFEAEPILNNYDFYDEIRNLPEVKHIQQYAYKGGIIKAKDEIQGVVLKGIDTDFDWSFFKQYMVEGDIFTVSDTATTNQVIISETIAKMLNLKAGDTFDMYFVQEPVRIRRLKISGIYNTYFEDMDKTFIIGDIKNIRRLNQWNNNQISGMEIMLHKLDDTDAAYEKIDDMVGYLTLKDGAMFSVTTLQDAYPQIFNWLAILDMNVLIILIIMVIVAGFNMISSLIIMLLDKIPMIGILKAMGMQDSGIRKIFIYRSSIIVFKGLLYGNLFGLLLCILQQQFGIITLDPQNYFFTTAPIHINWLTVILLNVGSFAVIILAQVLPTFILSKFSPDKTIRKD